MKNGARIATGGRSPKVPEERKSFHIWTVSIDDGGQQDTKET